MDTVALLGSTLGLGFTAGIRLYATILALGLGMRFGLFHPSGNLAGLALLSHTPVLIAAGLAYACEFLADKIPWIDTFWDAVHTIVRPLGAALLAATALGNVDPALKLVLVLLAGGVALTGHSAKAATRLIANHSPEPVSNIGLSLLGDVLAPAGVWMSLKHPYVMLGAVAAFVIAFSIISPRVFRLWRVQVLGAGRRISSLWRPLRENSRSIAEPLAQLEAFLAAREEPLPEEYKQELRCRRAGDAPVIAARAIACKNVKGLRNSIGYLCLREDELFFLTKRFFRMRCHRVKAEHLEGFTQHHTFLFDEIRLMIGYGEQVFEFFKGRPAVGFAPAPAAVAAAEAD